MLKSLAEFRVQSPLGVLALILPTSVTLFPHPVQVEVALIIIMQTYEAVMRAVQTAQILPGVNQVQSAGRRMLLLMMMIVMLLLLGAVVLLLLVMVVVMLMMAVIVAVMVTARQTQRVEVLIVVMVLGIVVLLLLKFQAHYCVDEVRPHAHWVELYSARTVGTAVTRTTAWKSSSVHLEEEK